MRQGNERYLIKLVFLFTHFFNVKVKLRWMRSCQDLQFEVSIPFNWAAGAYVSLASISTKHITASKSLKNNFSPSKQCQTCPALCLHANGHLMGLRDL